MAQTKRKGMICLLLCAVLVIAMLFAVPTPAQAASKTKAKKTIYVLMIGNSLTSASGGIVEHSLEKLGKAAGYNLKVYRKTYGGEHLSTYASVHTFRGQEVRRKLKAKKWDYVIFQEHTDYAIAAGTKFGRAVRKLKKAVRKYAPTAKIMLNCTWAYKNARWVFWGWFPHGTQQSYMNRNYAAAAKNTGATVIWSGKAFAKYRSKYNYYELYRPDWNHGTTAGYYLDACCIFKKITGQNSYKVRYYAGLGKEKAQQLQKAADLTN